MKKTDCLQLLDKIAELEPGTLAGAEALHTLSNWDSMKMLEFIALADAQFGLAVSPRSVAQAKTINDLIALLGRKITT